MSANDRVAADCTLPKSRLAQKLAQLWRPAAERAASAPAARLRFESIEPRVLLSADLAPETATAMQFGLDFLGAKVDDFLTGDEAFAERVPLLLKVTVDEESGVITEAPTVGDLFSVPVDANGDGEVDRPFIFLDDDEAVLDSFDTDHDDVVDAGEFLNGFLFDPLTDFLATHPANTQDVVQFIEGFLFSDGLDRTLSNLAGSGYLVDFDMIDAQVMDTTETPDAEATIQMAFELTITRQMPIDLGLEADGLKLLAFTGSSLDPQPVNVPVESTLSFGFEFGVHTGGTSPITVGDFFVRRADPLLVSVLAQDSGMTFSFNVGFLGAQVINGNLDLQADIASELVDPDDPEVLGFVDSQHGIESTTGVVTASESLPDADLEHEAGFFLRIGNVGVSTPVTVADNDAPDVATLKSHIQAALVSAGLDEVITADITGGKVQFALAPTSDTPLGFANETLADGFIQATPDGDGPNDFEYLADQVFLLSVGGQLARAVTVRFANAAEEELGFDPEQDAGLPEDVDQVEMTPTAFEVTGDADFTITVTANNGFRYTNTITVGAGDTNPGDDIFDLAAAIQDKLDNDIFLDFFLDVTTDGTSIQFEGHQGTLSAIRVEASGTAVTELGFSSVPQQATLQLTAANNAIGDGELTARATFRVDLVDVDDGAISERITIAPDAGNNDVGDLADDVDDALEAAGLGTYLDAIADGDKIVLVAKHVDVASFSVTSLNENTDDLAHDVNAALADAGLGSQVTASNVGGQLRLSANDGTSSLEISKTLTFDAGVTFAELVFTPTEDLFEPAVDEAASHATFELPVHVRPGLENPDTMADWDPQDVVLLGSFSPLDPTSPAADFNEEAKRFELHFSFDHPTIENQDDSPVAVPALNSLNEEIQLVNMAELLNFSLVNAEGMTGLLGGLGSALQQLSTTFDFAAYDIPFADATLADLINFRDDDRVALTGLIDRLLFDAGEDGLQNEPSGTDTDRLLRKIIEEERAHLIPNFVTAQEMASLLSTVLGVPLEGEGGINATYDTDTNELTYELDLIADDITATTITTPFEYDVDLGPFQKTVVDSSAPDEETEVTLSGRTGLEMTFGIDLSPPGTLIFPDTLLDKLSGAETDAEKRGIRIKTEHAITGTVDIPVSALPNTDVPNPAPTDPVQQLTGDAEFSISIGGGMAVPVTVEAESTYFVHPVTMVVTGNRTMSDLVEDVNNALEAAEVDGDLFADYDGRRLVISARHPGVEFEIVSANSFAEDELGLAVGATANRADFVIHDSDGGTHAIVLDALAGNPAATVQDVIDAINAQTGGAVVASLNAAHTGLRLTDTTEGMDDPFRINSVNGSSALLGLGFFRAGDEDAGDPLGLVATGDPHLIEGGAISQVHLDKRFFVRDAEMRIDGLTLSTPEDNVPPGVPGSALFGIVGVDTTFEGSMVVNVTAGLQSLDPVTSQVTLAELFEKSREVMEVEHRVIDDVVVSKAQTLDYGPFLGSFTVGELVTGNDSGATALVVAVDTGEQTLTLSHVKGNFNDGELISQSSVLALADGVLATNAHFGEFNLGVDVQAFSEPGEFGFGGGFGLIDGMHYDVPVELTVFGDPGIPGEEPGDPPIVPRVAPVANLDLSGIGHLAAFELLSYSHLAEALHELEAVLVDVNASFALFNQKIPSINRSVSDLLKLVDGFEHAVDNADGVLDAAELTLAPEGLELPALTLQDMAQALRGAFGLPDEVDPSVMGAVDWVQLDFDPVDNMLLIDLSLNESLSTKLGLDIETGDGLPNLTSGGILKVSGSLDVNLRAGIDLAAPENAYLFDDSSISAELHVEGEGQSYDNGEDGAGMVFYSSVGPLAVFIRDADAIVDVAFSLPGLDLGMDGRKALDQVAFEDFNAPDTTENNVAIVLPMFYGGEGPDDFLGEYSAMGNLDGLTVMTPDFSPLADDITNEVIPFDPFDNIELAIDTLDLYFEGLTDRISSDFLSLNLPFAGDQLADYLFIDQFRDALVGTLKNGIANAINPDPGSIVKSLLDDVFGPGGELEGYLEGEVVAVHNVGEGVPIQDQFREWRFTIARTGVNADMLTLDDFDLGIPNLDFDVDVPVLVSFDWEIDVAFGVSFGEGAYIDVSDIDLDGTDIDLDLELTLPGGSHTGELGYLRVDVTDPGADTGAELHFDINVQNGSETSAQRLAFADLGNLDAEGTLSGGALMGAPMVSLHLVTVPQVGLPTMTADFELDWSIAPPAQVASLGGDAVNGDISKIALTSMTLDPFSVLDAILGDLLDEVNSFIAPFMPVVDTLTAPIPILSDVAGEPFTLLDLAGIFGEVDPRFLETIADILDIIVAIESFTGADALPLGDLVVYEPGAGIADFVPGASEGLADIVVTLGLDGLTHNEDDEYDDAIASNSLLEDLANEEFVEGLAMPIFTDPTQGIKMLLGQGADIITYELQPLMVDFSYFQVFPIVGPLSVGIEIGFGFMLDLHEVGFDTTGYKRYADGGFRNPEVIFDGFFFGDLDENEVDAPEIQMLFSLVGSAELNAGIARAGVGGGIEAIITFDWHDSIPDGNVHISEILGNIEAEGPFGMFDLGGELTFELFAFIEALGVRVDIPITGKQTAYKFEDESTRDPILATVIGDTLQLNMGPNSKDRLNGDTSDGHEEFFVKYVGDGIEVWSPKLGVTEHQKYTGDFTNVVGLGGQGNDVIELRNFDGSGIRGDFDGGVGDDRIEYVSSGASMSMPGARIVGGEGNDTLTGGDLNDVIYGGEGNDTINGSAGYDILFGDSGRVADGLTPPFISSRVLDSDGDDTVSGGDGDDVIFGAGGDDMLDGGAGNDVIIGDGGRFEYTTTGGHVDIAALRPAAYVPTPVTTPVDPQVISDEIDAIHAAMTSTFTATDFGFGGDDHITGGDDDDMILGGTGDDFVDGEGGDDIILGGKGFDDLHGGDDDDTMFGGDQADTMAGDAGDDVMSGGRGNDFMHGNEDDDVMKGDSGADVMFGDAGDDQVFGQTEPDILFGGADDDLVVGGTSNDIMFGDDGIVAKLDPADGSALREIGIGFGGVVPGGQFFDDDPRTFDLILTDVLADDGNDILSGDAGDDLMLGGGGNDLMGGDVDPRLATFTRPTEISEDVLIGDGGKIVFDQRRFRSIETVIGPDTTGEPFHDVIYGDNGNDYVFGGRGNDFLFGGHGKVVDMNTWALGASRGATDAEADDNDIIVGDNGEMLFADDTIEDNFGRLELVRTTDVLEDTGGHDYVEGELDDDVIFGGVNGGLEHDVLLGHEGDDVVLGDNGELDWALGADTNLDTLDLIRSYRDGLGGTDEVSGHAGNDVLIGGTAGDLMYGDDATASAGDLDGEDIMLGDNADIFLIGTDGRLKVRVADMTQGTAVDLITTTDDVDPGDPDYDTREEAEAVGGPDTMSGNAKADVMIGGVNADDGVGLPEVDVMFGDREIPNATTIEDDADDILLGDNGLLDFTFDGDMDRNTLDLIRSFEDALGGTDVISGNKGQDVAIGGTAGDQIFGDDFAASAGSADLGDLLLGDNADVFLVDAGAAAGGDLKKLLDSAVKTIRTTDEDHETTPTGGVDEISGNADGDLIAGGVEGDTLYGDAASVVPELDGDDVILGDNGAFEWLSDGRLAEILGIDIEANNAALWAKYGTAVADEDLTTLDLITTEQPNNGGRDTIFGDEGNDLAFGGTDLDWMYGDDGNEVAEVMDSLNRDTMFGDHGRLYPQFSALPNINSRNFFAIDTGDGDGGEGDLMWGEEGDDVMLGQQGDDRMWGGTEDDDMIGGHNVSGGFDELSLPAVQATLNPPMNDLMDGGSGDDAMAGDNTIMWRRGDDLSPRFRTLDGTALYTTGPDQVDTIVTNVNPGAQSDPDDAVGRDIELVDHADGTPVGLFGADVMAGGADSDVMYGQLGNDLMQGDGDISDAPDAFPQFITHTVSVTDSPSGETDDTLYFNVPELGSDADDYMEGNGGDDLMYGGLGQDDIIGGSSGLFGLTTEEERPDGSDIIFGGAGAPVRLERNDFVGSTDTDTGTDVGVGAVPTDDDPSIALVDRHSRDADYIMGDNANVYRLVGPGDVFLEYNFDQSSVHENRGAERIVVRAMEQLDYTLGGADYAGGTYTAGVANDDNGLGDLIHGESGDDQIFGMTGSDVLFGESDDDDIVGGYGNDWISGGTGQDGILGDDGLVYTSRNSTLGEPLYGVEGLLANDPSSKYNNGTALNELISTPGDIQIALINIEGELKKTADLVPFSFDPAWLGLDDEFPDNEDNTPFADDIIFGGLGGDFLHGGSGDDAISGAEALEEAYVPIFDGMGNPSGILDLGYDAFTLADPIHPGDSVASPNPGDVLAFNPVDLDGQHLNNRFRAGEFFLYDEYDPRMKILLDGDGNLWKDDSQGVAYEFLLNFDKTEGVWRAGGEVPKATGQQTPTYDPANDDGKDAIFGDLGNDWLVGGTGRDNVYGGWGNDLLNADDDHETETEGVDADFDNESPDTHPFYEDRAYGGAGRDILIGNTGGDRLIDWVGEYNSYIVPYAPFGQASVSRTMMPHLHEFLYALSAGDGADFTRFADAVGGTEPVPTNNNPIPSRNGEPHGELGLVLQQDFAWGDQTGAPSDPQAGNIPGGPRDVLRSAGFQDGSMEGFFVDTGKFSATSQQLQVAADSPSGDAVSVWHLGDALPGYFELQAKISVVKPTAGWKANAYVVFDYVDQDDFKFAGIDDSTNKVVVGHRTASGWTVDKQTPYLVKPDTPYNMLIAINGVNVTVVVNNEASVTHTFAPRVINGLSYGLNYGLVGVGSDSSRGTFDNIAVQVLPPQITFETTEEFGGASPLFPAFAQTGDWSTQPDGRFAGSPDGGGSVATALMDLGVNGLYLDSLLDLSVTVNTATRAGFVFDRYSAEDFKFAAIDPAGDQVIIGHHSAQGGWTTDAAFARAIDAGKDYELGIVLKNAGVTVKLDGQVLGGHVYNAVTVDGDFGLLAIDGPAAFDDLTVKTDDAGFVPAGEGESLMAATSAPEGADAATVTQSEVDTIASAALTQWIDALGAGDPRLAALAGVRFSVADLEGDALGYRQDGLILVDADAAGHGWFVDASTADSSEFRVRLDGSVLAATRASDAYGRMDLLTVIAHELGHVLGLDHDDASAYAVMQDELAAGVRYAVGSGPAVPAFDLDGGNAGGGSGEIDWLGAADAWAPTHAAYRPTSLPGFLVMLGQQRGDAGDPLQYDSLGQALLGRKGKPG